METQVRTPQMVFMQPQRLIVPLFQRPYVWNRDNQWEPLWNDVIRVAHRVLEAPQLLHPPHFLGAVVVQQIQNPVGSMQEHTIIDGQQRLTTLQLLLDALHAELTAVGATQAAMRIEPLVANAEPFCERAEDRFKVWPTNRDRLSFNAVMSADLPVDYDALGFGQERMVAAHRFFAEQSREWLGLNGPEEVAPRAAALERTAREMLQIVVIDLTAEENAQEIFETLNARGAPLTAADLIKNFVFQRLLEAEVDVEAAYKRHWREFETAFWEAEISYGRTKHSRSSAFLNQWLIARTGQEIVAREVFARFKTYADFDSGAPMFELVAQVDAAAAIYRSFVEAASTLTGPIDRLGLFAYRTSVLESEVVKPLVLALLDPEQAAIEENQLRKAIDVVESWLVRRMLVRATTKAYNQVIPEMIAELDKADRECAGDVLENFLRNQQGSSRYWPDDSEVTEELANLLAYRRLGRGRLRMVLEAIEDHKRGWRGTETGLGGERVARGKYAIEHVLPRKWQTHWPLAASSGSEAERDRLLHTLGNLTLLTSRLNSRVSNGPWGGEGGKRSALDAHDVLLLNRHLLDAAGGEWTDDAIRKRTRQLSDTILAIWPVPEGHVSGFAADRVRPRHRMEIADLIAAGMLEPGGLLYARRKTFAGRTATVLPDGRLDVDGVLFDAPSPAAGAIVGHPLNGWRFFCVDAGLERRLSDVARDYVDQLAVDVDEGELAEDDEDDG